MRRPEAYRGNIAVLLVVICLLLFGVLLLARILHPPRRLPHAVAGQMTQFNVMNTALELFNIEYGDYPPSDANDPVGQPYCGSMKLCEALLGQDLLGFHSELVFRRDGLDATGTVRLYPEDIEALSSADRDSNLRARKGPYVQAENANAYRLADIYGEGNTGPFPADVFVLCDTYEQKRPTGERTGMPILYYRADPKGKVHDPDCPDDPSNIYDYRDNHALVLLGVPGDPNAVHPLADPKRFYLNTQSDNVTTESRPFHPDKFILISAGYDGLYGTGDDICNFDWQYRER